METALHGAVVANQPEIVAMLIKAGELNNELNNDMAVIVSPQTDAGWKAINNEQTSISECSLRKYC
jgi:hypothetical protein